MSTIRTSGSTGVVHPTDQNQLSFQDSSWAGWIEFAAIMMVFIGGLHIIQGLVALFNDEYYLVGKSGLTVHVDYTVWGWVHIIAGILVMCAGFGLFSGQMWARVVGVILVLVSMLTNFAFIAAYPFWSIIVIALDVFVLLALTVHGREMKPPTP